MRNPPRDPWRDKFKIRILECSKLGVPEIGEKAFLGEWAGSQSEESQRIAGFFGRAAVDFFDGDTQSTS